MLKFYTAILFTLLSISALAQQHIQKLYGQPTSYDEGVDVAVAPNGYLVSGAYYNPSNMQGWDSYLLYVDQNLDTIWTKKGLSVNGKVKPTADGNYIFAGGNTAGFVYDSIQVTKMNLFGQIIWTKSFFFPLCKNSVTSIKPIDDGYLVTGIYASNNCSNPMYDSFIMKLDENGDEVWTNIVNGPGNEQINAVSQLSNGTIVASGWTNTKTRNMDIDFVLVMLNPDGTLITMKTYDELSNDYSYDMTVLDNDDMLLIGYADSMKLIKLNADGGLKWKKTYGPSCGSSYFRVAHTSDNGFALLGSETVNGNCTSVFMKTDIDGNVLWKKNFDARLREFIEDETGSFVLTGYKNYLPDAIIIKFDSTRFEQQVAGPNNQNDIDTIQFTSINELENTVSVIAYPNPATEQITIKWESTQQPITLHVFDMKGSLIFDIETKFNNSISINRNQLPGGLYTYKIRFENNTITGKFIFQ